MAKFRALCTIHCNPDGLKQATGEYRPDGSAIVRAIPTTYQSGDVIMLTDDAIIADMLSSGSIEPVE